jgi:hypothetical protein
VYDNVSRPCRAVRNDVKVTGEGWGVGSANNKLTGVVDDEALALAKLFLSEEKPVLVAEEGGADALCGGEDGRLLVADGGGVGEVLFLFEVNGRRNDHSDSN